MDRLYLCEDNCKLLRLGQVVDFFYSTCPTTIRDEGHMIDGLVSLACHYDCDLSSLLHTTITSTMFLFSNFLPFAPGYIRVVAVLYVCVAAVYTTNSIVSSVTRMAIARLPREMIESSMLLQHMGDTGSGSTSLRSAKALDDSKARLFSSKSFAEKIYWKKMEPEGSYLLSGLTRGRDPPPSTDSGVFFAKAFATSQELLSFNDQNNMQIIPYYYRGSADHDNEDITITTLVTRDRFLVFKQLVERYKGPISATVHVSKKELGADSGSGFIGVLHQLYSSSPLMALNVDIHLVVTPAASDRQFNTWRNIARMFARTDYVMMLDVDFVPCTNFRQRLKIAAGDEIKALVRSGEAALVVPAFEFTNHEDGLDAATFPADKEVGCSLLFTLSWCSHFPYPRRWQNFITHR